MRLPTDRQLLWGILSLAVGMRLLLLCWRPHEIHLDPDAYLGIARNLWEGRGFSSPGSTTPTAFRPPVYPLLIAPFSTDAVARGRGLLNIVAAVCGVLCVWQSGKNLGLNSLGCGLAAVVYGCDPLLLRYSSLTMTEIVCSALAAALVWRITLPGAIARSLEETSSAQATVDADEAAPGKATPDSSRLESRSSLWWRCGFWTGVIFGLCALTRPTFWVFALMSGLVWGCWGAWQARVSPQRLLVCWLPICVGTVLVVLPWLVRNWVVLQSPILMTTHGGYTILLGNNVAFYEEVVRQPWGTVWDGSRGPGQEVWAEQLNQELDALGLVTEVERDREMSRRAWQTIYAHPDDFLRSCLLRLVRFWHVVPQGPAAEGLPKPLLWLVGGFYSLLWVLLLTGCWRLIKSSSLETRADSSRTSQRSPVDRLDRSGNLLACHPSRLMDWVPVLLLIVAFTAVHVLYWSNARMRAPVVPAIALLAGLAVTSRNKPA